MEYVIVLRPDILLLLLNRCIFLSLVWVNFLIRIATYILIIFSTINDFNRSF